ADLIFFLGSYLREHPLGYMTTPDGGARLMPGLVRLPDVSFFSWKSIGRQERLTDAIAGVVPELAVEVLSPSNTRGEMERKLGEYFLAGVKLAWLIDPFKRTVKVHTLPDTGTVLEEGQTLDGGDVLPGFRLELTHLFAGIPRNLSGSSGRKRRRRR